MATRPDLWLEEDPRAPRARRVDDGQRSPRKLSRHRRSAARAEDFVAPSGSGLIGWLGEQLGSLLGVALVDEDLRPARQHECSFLLGGAPTHPEDGRASGP
jgi:hypothetical protein